MDRSSQISNTSGLCYVHVCTCDIPPPSHSLLPYRKYWLEIGHIRSVPEMKAGFRVCKILLTPFCSHVCEYQRSVVRMSSLYQLFVEIQFIHITGESYRGDRKLRLSDRVFSQVSQSRENTRRQRPNRLSNTGRLSSTQNGSSASITVLQFATHSFQPSFITYN